MTYKFKCGDLPKLVKESDLKWPKKGPLGWTRYEELGVPAMDCLRFYRIRDERWVLLTLHISNASKRQSAGTPARFYSIGLDDKKVYTVGRGPHVTKEIAIYLSEANVERLMPYITLWKQGLDDASKIRDRISSRRAQGQLHRAAGRSSWSW